MRIAVLCGGKGTRLGEPIKCLTEVAGWPFMDWKIDQLEWAGATDIVLLCGPYANEFRKRYGTRVCLTDDQTGVRNALCHVDRCWWTWGDTLIAIKVKETDDNLMYVRHLDHGNIAGIYQDVGLYYGKTNHRLIGTSLVPHHINTRADLEETDAHLRRYGFTR